MAKYRKIIKVEVPFTHLSPGKNYKLVTYIEGLKKGYLRDSKNQKKKIVNIFKSSSAFGIFTVNIPKKMIGGEQRILLEHHLSIFNGTSWKEILSKNQFEEDFSEIQIVEMNYPLIGSNLEKTIQTKEEIQAEMLTMFQINTGRKNNYIKKKQDEVLKETSKLEEEMSQLLINKEEIEHRTQELESEIKCSQIHTKMLKGQKEEYQKIIDNEQEFEEKYWAKVEEVEKKNQEIAEMEDTLDEYEETESYLKENIKRLQERVRQYKDINERRQPKIYREVNDSTIENLAKIKEYPKEIIGYDWQIAAKNKILAKDDYPLIYALVGKDKEHNRFLLKIGSAANFPHRQATYDYSSKDGHFEIGSMVTVSHLLLSNVINPKIPELLIRYVFEEKYLHRKAYHNEWFECDLEMMNDLKKIFEYFDNHLSKGSVLDQMIKHGSKLTKDTRKSFFHKQAKPLAKVIFRL